MFNFEKLDVWQKAIGFADDIYRVTKPFPSDERVGLTNQMRRAAVFISSNIAEGSSRNSRIDYGRFVEIATGSLCEAVSQGFIAERQGFLAAPKFAQLHQLAQDQSRLLNGLKAYLVGEHSDH